MGTRLTYANHSPDLAALILKKLAEDWEVSDFCELTSTSGYDNDGSTGPELVDNGIRLGRLAAENDHAIWYAIVDDTAYYVVSRSESEAIKRLELEMTDEDTKITQIGD